MTRAEFVAWMTSILGLMKPEIRAEWESVLADADLGALLRKLPQGWELYHGFTWWASYGGEDDGVVAEADTPEAALKMAVEKEKDDSAT